MATIDYTACKPDTIKWVLYGWVCPVCGRGVRPGQDTCDHGYTPPVSSEPFIPGIMVEVVEKCGQQ